MLTKLDRTSNPTIRPHRGNFFIPHHYTAPVGYTNATTTPSLNKLPFLPVSNTTGYLTAWLTEKGDHNPMKIMVMNSSVREHRAASIVLPWVVSAVKKHQDIDVDVVDLKELDLPMLNTAVHPISANGQYDEPKATAWAKRVAEADSFILVVAEYNHGYPAAIKNALDWVAQGWWYKPVSFVSYGGLSGGIRAVEQLRQVVLELRMFPLHEAVHIPFVRDAFNEQGQPVRESMNDNLEKLVDELLIYTAKLKA